jgi:hypothetical protein
MDDEKCNHCGQELPQPKNIWLTTSQVTAVYGFNPGHFPEEIKNKLQLTTGDGPCARLWLQAAVEQFVAERERS